MDSVEVGLVAAVAAVLPGAGVVVLELVGAQPLLRRVVRVVGMSVARVVAGVCSQQRLSGYGNHHSPNRSLLHSQSDIEVILWVWSRSTASQ